MGMSFLFIRVEVDALGFERGLGLLPCCLVPWCRLWLRPLLGAGIFVVVGGEVVIALAASPSVSAAPRCDLPVCFIACAFAEAPTQRCLEALLVTGNLPQLNDPTMISVGTKVTVMLLLQNSQQ